MLPERVIETSIILASITSATRKCSDLVNQTFIAGGNQVPFSCGSQESALSDHSTA